MKMETAIRLPESECKVMQYLWDAGQATAKETAQVMAQQYGWKKNTTYTILKHLVEKEVILREEPDFLCKPLVDRDDVALTEADTLLDRFYQGSAAALFSSFLHRNKISQEELDRIRELIDRYED